MNSYINVGLCTYIKSSPNYQLLHYGSTEAIMCKKKQYYLVNNIVNRYNNLECKFTKFLKAEINLTF